ncbi:MAG: helix-turn-helix transcriptional regulator [Actinomycetota bacterium]
MTPAELISRARRRAGYTQAELAARAGISQSAISAYERGERDPAISSLRRILAAAGARLELHAVPLAVAEAGEPTIADARDRGARLVDVLLLADAVPIRRHGGLTFPRISTS